MTAGSLFAGPIWSTDAHRYRMALRAELERDVVPLIERAERERRFPAEILRRMGSSGHMRRRWEHPGQHGDLGCATVFANEWGKLLAGGLAAGVSVHVDSSVSVLRSAPAGSVAATKLYDQALSGEQLFCVGITERGSGSDPGLFRTTATEEPDGSWTLHGHKKYISLAIAADQAIVLARTGEAANALAFFAVPNGPEGYRVVRELGKHGTHSVETCELRLDGVRLAADRLVVRGSPALAAMTRALVSERIAVCAQLVGALEACLEIVRGYLQARPTRTGHLWDFQALRHRFAGLMAEQKVLFDSVIATALAVQEGRSGQQATAALKLAVAPRVELAISESMQMLGGLGYLDDVPVERALRDVRLARIAAGTDDVMREIVATAVLPADRFDRHVRMTDEGEGVRRSPSCG